jgi:D-galactarolactone cycloisomerase
MREPALRRPAGVVRSVAALNERYGQEARMRRREVIGAAIAGPAALALARSAAAGPRDLARQVREVAERPVLRRDRLAEPVIVRDVAVLHIGDQFVVRVRATSGAEGHALCNPDLMRTLHPVLTQRIAPAFVGKDARDLHALQDALWLNRNHYKWQGLPFWAPHAWLELALLDLIGKVHGLGAAALLGDPVRRDSGIYFASGDRENAAGAVVDELEAFVARSGSRAVKLRLGARLGTSDWSDARDVALIPLARQRLGDDAILYADANSSYGVDQAIRTGRLLAEQRYAFFEEPVLFDDMTETRRVSDALDIPVAGGEVESSLRRFEYMIINRVVDIVQPDLIYFGGITRALRVARMAQAAGMQVVPHMSGGGLGFLYVLHFAAVAPNTTDHQEYKGDEDAPYVVTGRGKPLEIRGGRVAIPDGPGLGVTLDPAWLEKARIVTA